MARYSIDGREIPMINGFKAYENKGGGNPYHDELGRFTTASRGKMVPLAKKVYEITPQFGEKKSFSKWEKEKQEQAKERAKTEETKKKVEQRILKEEEKRRKKKAQLYDDPLTKKCVAETGLTPEQYQLVHKRAWNE